MFLPDDNRAFWRSSEVHVAVSPRCAAEADSVREFANANEATRCLIFFQTSGSEGNPKWCGLSRAAMLASARAVNAHLETTAHDRWLIALPLHHVGGFSILGRCFASGASFVRMEGKWEAEKFAQLCAAEKITQTSLVPTQVFDLVQAGIQSPPSLRAVVVGGAGLSKEAGRRAHELGWPVLQSYGMTETASQVATEPLEHLCQGFDPERLELLRGWDVRCEAGGRLIVRGEALASGYAAQCGRDWRWEPIDRAAGFLTRDRVRLWSEGGRRFLSFIGRDAEFVKVMGELVNLRALQARLGDVAAAAGMEGDAAVIWASPDERSGTRLILAGAHSLAQLEDLRARFNATAQGFERIAESREVARIPRTALGKPDRAALGELLRGA